MKRQYLMILPTLKVSYLAKGNWIVNETNPIWILFIRNQKINLETLKYKIDLKFDFSYTIGRRPFMFRQKEGFAKYTKFLICIFRVLKGRMKWKIKLFYGVFFFWVFFDISSKSQRRFFLCRVIDLPLSKYSQ